MAISTHKENATSLALDTQPASIPTAEQLHAQLRFDSVVNQCLEGVSVEVNWKNVAASTFLCLFPDETLQILTKTELENSLKLSGTRFTVQKNGVWRYYARSKSRVLYCALENSGVALAKELCHRRKAEKTRIPDFDLKTLTTPEGKQRYLAAFLERCWEELIQAVLTTEPEPQEITQELLDQIYATIDHEICYEMKEGLSEFLIAWGIYPFQISNIVNETLYPEDRLVLELALFFKEQGFATLDLQYAERTWLFQEQQFEAKLFADVSAEEAVRLSAWWGTEYEAVLNGAALSEVLPLVWQLFMAEVKPIDLNPEEVELLLTTKANQVREEVFKMNQEVLGELQAAFYDLIVKHSTPQQLKLFYTYGVGTLFKDISTQEGLDGYVNQISEVKKGFFGKTQKQVPPYLGSINGLDNVVVRAQHLAQPAAAPEIVFPKTVSLELLQRETPALLELLQQENFPVLQERLNTIKREMALEKLHQQREATQQIQARWTAFVAGLNEQGIQGDFMKPANGDKTFVPPVWQVTLMGYELLKARFLKLHSPQDTDTHPELHVEA